MCLAYMILFLTDTESNLAKVTEMTHAEERERKTWAIEKEGNGHIIK